MSVLLAYLTRISTPVSSEKASRIGSTSVCERPEYMVRASSSPPQPTSAPVDSSPNDSVMAANKRSLALGQLDQFMLSLLDGPWSVTIVSVQAI